MDEQKNGNILELAQRISVVETQFKAIEIYCQGILKSQDDLKQGLALRVEQGGKDIAVLKKEVQDLEDTKKWVVSGIGAAILAAIGSMIFRNK